MSINRSEIIKKTDEFLDSLKLNLKEIQLKDHQNIIFNSAEFRTKEILNESIYKVKKSSLPLIYTIELLEISKLPKLLGMFENFSEKNKLKVKNKDRVNVSKYNKTLSSFLYVGSSTTDFYSRLKNHFGTRGNRVYSMHLCKWDNDTNYDLKISTYIIENLKNLNTTHSIVELVEQQVWDELKPNFGKRSGQ
tara:strand:- start:142 stop:717 length:576 start_codon:yes stop_codon:yes gene_type:complete